MCALALSLLKHTPGNRHSGLARQGEGQRSLAEMVGARARDSRKGQQTGKEVLEVYQKDSRGDAGRNVKDVSGISQVHQWEVTI